MMTDAAYKVKAFLDSGGLITARLRELSTGETQDLVTVGSSFQSLSLCPQDIIASLEELERAGIIVRSEAVNPYDSSEYIIVWRLA